MPKNTAAMLTGPRQLSFMERPLPSLGPEDLLVEVKHVGICGSDVAVFADPTLGGEFPDIPLPILLGHECAGVVRECGAAVTNLRPGDLVALEPGIPCGRCDACMSGHYNLCNDVIFMAAPPWSTGALCSFVVHPARWAFKLPTGMGTLEGALMEPFAVGMSAAAQGSADITKTAVVLGCGCIGMMTALACRARGIRDVILVDLFDSHLDIARSLGFTRTVNSGTCDMASAVLELTGGRGADLVFETAGSAATLRAAPDMTVRGGTIVLVGNIHGEIPFNFWKLSFNEITLKTVFRYRGLYPHCIRAAANGLADVGAIGVKCFPFAQAQQAFECALTDKQSTLKAVVEL